VAKGLVVSARVPARNPAAGSSLAGLRHNNFDLLRFGFAFTVFLVHAHALTGQAELALLSQWLSSELAVQSFFVVSGFLIFKSFEDSSSTGSYFGKRLRRIYPAYCSVIVGSAVLGVVMSTLPWQAYFGPGFLKYIAANLVFLNFLAPDLPGLFGQNTLTAVNGALWTLKIEVMFYLLVPVMVGAMRRYGYLFVLALLYILSLAYFEITGLLALRSSSAGMFLELQRQLPGQLTYFVAGALGYYYLAVFSRYGWQLAAMAALAFALRAWLPWVWIGPLALASLVVGAACLLPCLGNFGKYGDFSYGIYILHFPLLQTLVSLGLFEGRAVPLLLAAAAMLLILAVLLWHFVEQPWLQRSSHYRSTTHTVAQA
jgi:peptidoglycan/LPS O-acetylase OafA/YrhL